MPRTRTPTAGSKSPGDISSTCEFCDPPDRIRDALGSAIGQYRHQHYLTFPTTDSLSQHLKTFVQPFPPPEKGYTFEQWLQGVLSWHRQQLSWKAKFENTRPQERPDPPNERAAASRRWSLLAGEAKTPDAMDRLAGELLSPGAASAVRVWTDIWRRENQKLAALNYSGPDTQIEPGR